MLRALFLLPLLFLLLSLAALPRQATAASDQPADYAGWMQHGHEMMQQGNHEAAIAAFRSAIFLHPELAAPHDALAGIHLKRNDLQAAVRELETAQQLDRQGKEDTHPEMVRRAREQARASGLTGLDERLADLVPDRTPTTPPAGVKSTAIVAADADQRVREALEAWRKAWSARDVEAYLAAYAPDFDPGKRFSSRKAWQDYKRRIIGKQTHIEISIDGLETFARPDGSYRAVFTQHYRSPSHDSDDLKVLWFVRTADGWMISREISN